MPDLDDQPSAEDPAAAQGAPSPWDSIDLNKPGYGDLYPGGLGDFSGVAPDLGHRFGQAFMAVATGQDPDTVHPSVRPLMGAAATMLRPDPPLGPGLLGSLDQLKALQGGQAAALAEPIDRPNDRGIASDQSVGPRGLQDVGDLPIGGANVVPRFDGLIADKVSSFFKTLEDRGVPVKLRDGFRTADAQAKLAHNKNGGASPGNGLHEAGLAFDVNWDELGPTQRQAVLQAARDSGFQWGGHFRKVDAEHFYVDPFSSLSERQAYIRNLQNTLGR